MEIKCKFKQQNEIAERGSFRSRKVWVVTEENPDYPQTIEVEVSQDKVNLFDGYRQGQPMTLSINLRGREWTNDAGKTFVFNTLQCWKIVSDQAVQEEEEEIVQTTSIKKTTATKSKKVVEDDENDLPF